MADELSSFGLPDSLFRKLPEIEEKYTRTIMTMCGAKTYYSSPSQDRFAYNNSVPVIDASQDLTLLGGGYENETHTVIKFSRPWDTCDSLQV